MPTNIYRLGDNLYRWAGKAHGNGWPIGIESFVKDAGTRLIIGRWLHCPNWGVAKQLMHTRNMRADLAAAHRALTWIVNNPNAHPANMVNVADIALQTYGQ